MTIPPPNPSDLLLAFRELGAQGCHRLAPRFARAAFRLRNTDDEPAGRIWAALAGLAEAVAQDEHATLLDALDPTAELTESAVDGAGLVAAIGDAGPVRRRVFASVCAELRDDAAEHDAQRTASVLNAAAILATEIGEHEDDLVAAWAAPEGVAEIVTD